MEAPARQIWLALLALHSSWGSRSCLLGTALWERARAGQTGWAAGKRWLLEAPGSAEWRAATRSLLSPGSPLPAHSWKCCLDRSV